MTNFAIYVSLIFSVLTVVAQIFALIIVLSLIFKKHYFSQKIIPIVRHYAFLWTFLIALGATLGSLIYSEIIGFEPCVLCWLQRAFLYPQVIILGIALWKKDHNILDYSLGLSIIGGIFAFYQVFSQVSGISITACTAVGGACAKVFFIELGYVTIPVMSFTAFLLMILFMAVKKFKIEE